jgi:hypothetical protein
MRSGEHDDPLESDTRGGAHAWFPLVPASIVAFGSPDRPVRRLLTLQSAVARCVHLATSLGPLRRGPSQHALLNPRFR